MRRHRAATGASIAPAEGLPGAGGRAPGSGATLAGISRAGLAYVAALRLRNPALLAGRLYRWHTLPDTPAWRRRLPTDAAVQAFLDIDRSIATTGLVEELGLRSSWREWSPAESPESDPGATICKLYLSPAPEAVPAALARIAPALCSLSALGLKLPRQRSGLLRPDKVLLYFATLDALRAAATALAPLLHGIAAHGVPFTAALDDMGLLSWGADPPERQGGEDESWRVWLCSRLAAALAEAELSGLAMPARPQFALDRLALEGVDVASWSPIPGRWQPRHAGVRPSLESGNGAH